ncbi:MAG: hypothetical protein WAW10_07430 [Gallionella sp.]
MTDKQETNHAFARSRSNAGLCVNPVAWRRTDTPRTTITESEDIAFGWELDGLFYEPLYTGRQMDDMQAEIDRLRAELLTHNVKVRGCALLRSPSRLPGWAFFG